jgi:hypothetical protein
MFMDGNKKITCASFFFGKSSHSFDLNNMISTHSKDFCEKHGLQLPDFNFLNFPDFYNMFQQVAKVEK